MTCIFEISLSLACWLAHFRLSPYVIPAFYSEFMQTLARFIRAVSAEILSRLTSVNTEMFEFSFAVGIIPVCC